MDPIQAIAGQSPAVALAIICLFFLNKNNLDALRERKEILEKLQAERKEWLDTLLRIVDRYDIRLAAAIEANVTMKNELHSLRGKMAESMLAMESKLERLVGGTNAKS